MSNQAPLELLLQGAADLGLNLAPPTLEQFRFYLNELVRWNARVNLTGLKTAEEMVVKGFLDSLAILPYLGEPASLADLGAGAGFPGLVLRLLRPAMALILVEAREKKAAFLDYLVSCLRLPGVEVLRVHLTPDLARRWGPRFAVVVSRAAFPLAKFLELAAPLLLPGGRALALKGPKLADGELAAARNRVGALGLAPLELWDYILPIAGEPRLLVLARRPE